MAKFSKMFGRKSIEDKIPLYVPEIENTDPNSQWRKRDKDYLTDPRLLKKQGDIFTKIIVILTYICIFLCACIFLGIIKLLFFTTFEKTYIDDATYHTCVVKENGVEPYEY